MKFILNKDNLTIENKSVLNSGSINYYEAEVEHDESWDNLTIKAVLIKEKKTKGTAISVINNKIYLDQNLKGKYFIGFVGFTIEQEEKTYQISTRLKELHFLEGTGEIEAENDETVPTPTEWEIYIAQIQSITSEINGLADDLTAQVQEVEEKLEHGDFNGEDGADGISPTLTETQTQNGYDISITDKNGTRTISLLNGQPGTNGKDGEDGYTPQKGVDYFTEEEKEELLANYYKKEDTYSKTQIDNMVGNIESLLAEV